MWNLFNRVLSRNYSFTSNYPSSKVIRKSFIDYFVGKNDHIFIPSSSVKTMNPSIPFTNAGMNQFTNIFLGNEETEIKKAANFQKCIRVLGSHNDFDVIGSDGYHHTFFEMLGNWSFNDYYKEEACKLALDYLEQECKLPKASMYVTYFAGDESLNLEPDYECREIWLKLGFNNDQIKSFGLSENFWEMGLQGPCGPSTEIFINLSNNVNTNNCIEIWNLVFIIYNRLNNGQIVPLQKHFVDTGMGFERLVAILQNKSSNYDTDVFSHLFQTIGKICDKKYEGKYDCKFDTAYRILVDHSRMITISLADNITPKENLKLKKVIRNTFNIAKNFTENPSQLLIDLCYKNLEYFAEHYPEMSHSFQQIPTLIETEYHLYTTFRSKICKRWTTESTRYPELKKFDIYEYPGYLYSFLELKKIDNLKEIDAKLAYHFYNTYGLTKHAIQTLANNLQLSFNTKAFEDEFKQQQMISKLKRNNNVDSNGTS